MEKLNDGLKIFAQEDTRLVRASAMLFDFSLLDDVPSDIIILERYSVPVIADNKTIGSAALYYDGRAVRALISFDYATPERLDLELGEPLYAHPIGHTERTDPWTDRIDYVNVESIEVCREPNKSTLIDGGKLAFTYYENN